MHLSLRTSANANSVFLTLLTVFFTVTPRSVHAQPPTPSQSTDPPDYKYLGISFAALVGLLLLCGCCSFCCVASQVRDVERQPVAPPDPTQWRGQGKMAAAPAPPPQAHTKEKVLGVGAANGTEPSPDEMEPSPPPYYPSTSASPSACTSEGSHDANLNHADDELRVKCRWEAGRDKANKVIECQLTTAIGDLEVSAAQ